MNNEENKAEEVIEETKETEADEKTADESLENDETSKIKSSEEDEEDMLSMFRKSKDKNKKLSNEVEAYKDKLTRLQAEFDNYKKRTQKEKEGIYTDAVIDVLKEMLPVLDNLERAVAVEGSIEDIKKGIDMTINSFKTSFEKLQVEEISTKETFDPNLHNAVMHIEDSEFKEQEIVEVFQKGYKRGDKVLRHSMVKVAN